MKVAAWALSLRFHTALLTQGLVCFALLFPPCFLPPWTEFPSTRVFAVSGPYLSSVLTLFSFPDQDPWSLKGLMLILHAPALISLYEEMFSGD